MKQKIILLGEIHGIKENIKAIRYVVKTYGVTAVGFELDAHWNDALREASKGKEKKLLVKFKENEWIQGSGVFNEGYVSLLKWLNEKGIAMEAVYVSTSDWNQSEKLTAQTIRILAKTNKGTTLVVMGNYHARKSSFVLKGENDDRAYRPAGLLLGRQAVSILIRYGKGKARNFGLSEIVDPQAQKIAKEGVIMEKPSKGKYFDKELFFSKATPASSK